MPGGKGTTFQENLINYVLGDVEFTPPATYYIALFNEEFDEETDPIDETLTLSDEVDGSGYYRVEYTNNTDNWDGSGGQRYNVEDIEFPEATGDWGTIKAWAMLDVSTGGDGSNIFYYGSLDIFKPVQEEDTLIIRANSIVITEE